MTKSLNFTPGEKGDIIFIEICKHFAYSLLYIPIMINDVRKHTKDSQISIFYMHTLRGGGKSRIQLRFLNLKLRKNPESNTVI